MDAQSCAGFQALGNSRSRHDWLPHRPAGCETQSSSLPPSLSPSRPAAFFTPATRRMEQALSHFFQCQTQSAISCYLIPPLGVLRCFMRDRRRMGVAIARPSVSVLQTPWRTVVLVVGRFGGGRVGALESSARQTHPTYVPAGGCLMREAPETDAGNNRPLEHKLLFYWLCAISSQYRPR